MRNFLKTKKYLHLDIFAKGIFSKNVFECHLKHFNAEYTGFVWIFEYLFWNVILEHWSALNGIMEHLKVTYGIVTMANNSYGPHFDFRTGLYLIR